MQISMAEIFNMQRRAEIAEKGGKVGRAWDRELVARVHGAVNQFNDDPGDDEARQAEVARLSEEVVAFYAPPDPPAQDSPPDPPAPKKNKEKK